MSSDPTPTGSLISLLHSASRRSVVVRVGKLFIPKGITSDHVWIGHGPSSDRCGEGGDFPIAEVEALLAAYYAENF